MIGKIIVHGDTRDQALARMRTRCRRPWSKASRPTSRCTASDGRRQAHRGRTSIDYLEGWLDQHKR